jgi:D-sedoheptulose 7-phosphate isomerase
MINVMKKIIETLNEISNNFIKLVDQSTPDIQEASKLIIESLHSGRKIMFCGNGGSAADAQHLSAELVGRYLKNRKPLASISLTTDTSVITAISNDFSFDEIFSRQIESIGNEGDVLYAISTSSKSKNVIAALKTAKKLKIKTIGITGSENSGFKGLCDVTISVPALRPDRIQEMHIAVGHIICEILELELC